MDSSIAPTFLCFLLPLGSLWLSGAGQWLRDGEPRPLAQAVHPGTPWQLARELRDGTSVLSRELRHGRVFASETLGDYLLWSLAPDVPVTVYTHVHLFTPEHWQDCQRVKAGANGWRAVLERLQVRLVVCEADLHPGLCAGLRADRENWRILLDESGSREKADPKARLFVAIRK